MPPPVIKLGKQSGEHGSYSFYRSFSYQSGRKWRHVKLGRFFFVRLGKASPICIGELQLVWTGRYSSHPLASVRLYYLPEQLPDGRQSHHGQDELVATDKMVIHAKDLIKWIICEGVEWSLGLSLMSKDAHTTPSTASSNRKKCNKCSKAKDGLACNVQIIDFTSYCKLRTALKRAAGKLDFKQILSCPKLTSIYDLTNIQPNKYIMFCKETFDCPELENHDFRCDHLAPNLKGRPRKKTKGKHAAAKAKHPRVNSAIGTGEDGDTSLVEQNSDSRDAEMEKQKEAERYEKVIRQILTNKEHFTRTLYKHMKDVGTPISKIPSLGFKRVDLHSLFRHVYSAGGYKEICKKRLWKTIYDKLGGNPHNTSAPSCTKKQYERLLLSFERNIVLPGTAGKIKVPHMPSSDSAQRKPKLKTRLDKIRQEWSSLIKHDKAQQSLIDSDDKSVATTTGAKWQTAPMPSGGNSQKNDDCEPQLVIDDEAFDEDQIPLSMLSALKKKNSEKPSLASKSTDTINNTPSKAVVTAKTTAITITSTWAVPSSLPSVESSADSGKNSNGQCKTDQSELQPTGEVNNSPDVVVLSSQNGSAPAIVPAHGVLKASMPLNVLGPCLPDQLTFAQRSPWAVRLTIQYSNPRNPLSSRHLKRDSTDDVCEEALDLTARKKLKVDESVNESVLETKPDLAFDDYGAIDLSIKHNQPLDLIKCKNTEREEMIMESWKPQEEPINYSKTKAAPKVAASLPSTPSLMNEKALHITKTSDMQPYTQDYSISTKYGQKYLVTDATAYNSSQKTHSMTPTNERLEKNAMQLNAYRPNNLQHKQNFAVDQPADSRVIHVPKAKRPEKDKDCLMDLSMHVDPSWRTGNSGSTNDSVTNIVHASRPLLSSHQANSLYIAESKRNQPTSPHVKPASSPKIPFKPSYTGHRGVHEQPPPPPPPPPKYSDYHRRIGALRQSSQSDKLSSRGPMLSPEISRIDPKPEREPFPSNAHTRLSHRSLHNNQPRLVSPTYHPQPPPPPPSIHSPQPLYRPSAVYSVPFENKMKSQQPPVSQGLQLSPSLNDKLTQQQLSFAKNRLLVSTSDAGRRQPSSQAITPEQRLSSSDISREKIRAETSALILNATNQQLRNNTIHSMQESYTRVGQNSKQSVNSLKYSTHSPGHHIKRSVSEIDCQPISLAIPKPHRPTSQSAPSVPQRVLQPVQSLGQQHALRSPYISPPQQLSPSIHSPGKPLSHSSNSPGQRLQSSIHSPSQQLKHSTNKPTHHLYQSASSPGRPKQTQSIHSPGQQLPQPLASPEQFMHPSLRHRIQIQQQQQQQRLLARAASDHEALIEAEKRKIAIAAGVVSSTYHPGLVAQPSNLIPHSTHQRLASEPATSVTHMHPSLQRLPISSSISSSSPYEHFLPSYALPAPPRLQPIPSRHNHPSATLLQPKYRMNTS